MMQYGMDGSRLAVVGVMLTGQPPVTPLWLWTGTALYVGVSLAGLGWACRTDRKSILIQTPIIDK